MILLGGGEGNREMRENHDDVSISLASDVAASLRIPMEMLNIISEIGPTLCEYDDCPCVELIHDIRNCYLKMKGKTVLQNTYAAVSERQQALMDQTFQSCTKVAGLNADLHSSSSDEDDNESRENNGTSQYIDNEAHVDDDYELSEEENDGSHHDTNEEKEGGEEDHTVSSKLSFNMDINEFMNDASDLLGEYQQNLSIGN